MSKRVVVIGSGFAGLSAACYLAHKDYEVTVIEKNSQLGGRARIWHKEGFTFDMGPSWYWMPDVFEEFFAYFGCKPSDFYDLIQLDPGYRVFFGKDNTVDVPANLQALYQAFEAIEPGSAKKLHQFLTQAAYKYKVGMGNYVRRPSLSIGEFIDPRMIIEASRLQMLQPMATHVRSLFKDERLIRILEFPVLFLGGTAKEIPAMYSLMNHADLMLGTWYPMGGMRQIVEAMLTIATTLDVDLVAGNEAIAIKVENGKAIGVDTEKGFYPADYVIGAGDYQHIEQQLVPQALRTYSPDYWESRTLSPSSLLFYLGVNKKLHGLKHHNLFFDEPLEPHAKTIYETRSWPDKPLFYLSCPSQTDPEVAPEGCENVFALIPLAPGLTDDTEAMREVYFEKIMDRLETLTGQTVRDSIIVKRSYAHSDFICDYHAYKGNAYGLANTLKQTAIFKPRLQSKKVPNLYYAGQLTVPGPGVPPALLSGQIVAKLISG
jgi:phytoene desaturase